MHFELYYKNCTKLIAIVFMAIPNILRLVMINILLRLIKFTLFLIILIGSYIVKCIILKRILWSKFFRIYWPMRWIRLDKFPYLLLKLSFFLIYCHHFAWVVVINIVVILIIWVIEVWDLAMIIWNNLWIISIIWLWRNLTSLIQLT